MAEKQNILDYIPHRPPFVMLDRLLSATPEKFESEFYVDEDNVLVSKGFFLETGLIENIAQTSAGGFGFLDRSEDSGPRVGFIGAVTKVEVYELPPVGTTISTIVMPTHQLGNIVMVRGSNYLNDRKLLECEMKIVIS
ncbi:hypothetical protein DYBT9275_01528 [Dyadobacter sp. CECT 9275]|uniref:3-hydroxymyristoyl/3-hydroxydecanoyl-(Acyl carrier protein) dehydratase n=1 Tax=Dyadobacter helix TaxID=2822344 RepID=A0A916NBK4_9BACT|nr:hypothetical protein [Dyadobacter sp. CECT 9275]CAG4995035.1 hypothetical protein DYBT9275_01528 [Dyadobacter sp. CECT 9275]